MSLLLLNCNGSNGSTTFTDSSPYARTVTVNGDTQLTTADSRFGSACGIFDGSSDSLSLAASSDWELGSGNFSIELSVKSTQTTSYATLISKMPDNFFAGCWLLLTSGASSGNLEFWCADYNTGAPMLSTAGNLFNTGNWVDIELARYDNLWTLRVEGVTKASVTATFSMTVKSGLLYLGADQQNGRWFNGKMDAIRITKHAVHTADYTPYSSEPINLLPIVKNAQSVLEVISAIPSTPITIAKPWISAIT
jgi:hypothetical protein